MRKKANRKIKIERRTRTKFHTLIENIYAGLGDSNPQYIESTTSFINLNKRGGENKMNMRSRSIIERYCENYCDFIIKEIEIINPEYIFCLGKNSTYEWLTGICNKSDYARFHKGEEVKAAGESFKKGEIIINGNQIAAAEIYHPSAPRQIYEVAATVASAIKK